VVVALDLGLLASDVVSRVVGKVLVSRLESLGVASEVEYLKPVVPGRNLAVLMVTAVGPLAELERRLEKEWTKLVQPPTETELTEVRRQVAAELAAAASGPLGRARQCAAVAVGNSLWRKPADLELEVLSLPEEKVELVFEELPPWGDVTITGAGVLPVPESPAP
jgi:hypothetical protein